MGSVHAAARCALVLSLARQITARHDLDDVLSETFRTLRPMVAFAGGSVLLVDDEGWIQVAAAEPMLPSHLMGERVPLATSIAGRIVLTEQPVYITDMGADPLPLQRRTTPTAGVRSYLGVPLVADGGAIGVLQFDSPKPHAWTIEDQELLLAVAPVVAAAIQNARAHARSTAARAHSQATGRRLLEARHVVSSLKNAHRRGETLDVEALLERLEQLLGDQPQQLRPRLRVPRPRVPEGRLAVG